MFRIYDGREKFYQWDLNQKLIVEDAAVTEVHFCNRTDECSLVCETYTENDLTLVNVPNILLQQDWNIRVYAVCADYTKAETVFKVVRRTKPSDYIYTETEVKNYEQYEERLKALEERKLTAEDVGAVSTKGGRMSGGLLITGGENGSIYINNNGQIELRTPDGENSVNIAMELVPQNKRKLHFFGENDETVELVNIAPPTANDCAANKGYVDESIQQAKEELQKTEVNLDGAEYRKSLTVDATSRNFTSYDEANEDYISVKKFLVAVSKTDWLYGLYDGLMEQYPDYITRTKIAETADPVTCYSSREPRHTENYMPDRSKFTDQYMNTNASAVSYGTSSTNKTSPYFEVPTGKVLSLQYFDGITPKYVTSVRSIAAFDADFNYIPNSGVNNTGTGGMYTIPDNAVYLRVCVSKNYIDSVALKTMFIINDSGALLSEYVENKEGLPIRTGLKSAIPMYRYDFKPPIANRTINSTLSCNQVPIIPKILYVSGIHGGEYLQTIAAFRFFKMLCDKWQEYELLADLKWNVHFVVIPTANPFGYEYPSGRYDENGNSVSKRNERNIDISGNFPSPNYVENEGSEYKYGKTALTEPESIAIYNIIENENFILAIDNHNFNHIAGTTNTDKMGSYFIANQFEPNSVNFWWKISRCLNQKLRKLSPKIESNYDAIQIWTDSRKQMLNNTFRCVSANIEMSLGIDPEKTWSEEAGVSSMAEETQAFSVDTLAVVFHEALKDFYTY